MLEVLKALEEITMVEQLVGAHAPLLRATFQDAYVDFEEDNRDFL